MNYLYRISFFLGLMFLGGCDLPEFSVENFSLAEPAEVEPPSFIEFPAKVIRIIDGDTLEVMYGELPVRIRLAHIDSPERKQAFGTRAKQALSDLCFGKFVKIEYREKDRNGRYICVLYDESGMNINQEMVRLGMAWHFKRYSDDMEYDRLEKEARQMKVGLWSDANPVAPWEWRN